MNFRARNLKISKFASGYSLAVLAIYFVPRISSATNTTIGEVSFGHICGFLQKKNAMNYLFIAFLTPYSIFSLAVRSRIQYCQCRRCKDFDFCIRQLVQQYFKLPPLRRLICGFVAVKDLIDRDMIAGHQL